MTANPDNTELRITGSETEGDTVPVDVLVRVLEGLQQTALILATTIHQRTVEQHFRPSEQLRRKCELRCGPLTHSNSVAVQIGFDACEPMLFPDSPDERLIGRLLRFAGALAIAASLRKTNRRIGECYELDHLVRSWLIKVEPAPANRPAPRRLRLPASTLLQLGRAPFPN